MRSSLAAFSCFFSSSTTTGASALLGVVYSVFLGFFADDWERSRSEVSLTLSLFSSSSFSISGEGDPLTCSLKVSTFLETLSVTACDDEAAV